MKNKDRPEVQKACAEYLAKNISCEQMKSCMKEHGYNNSGLIDWLNEEYSPFTDFEKEFLSHIDINYKWIARDNNDHLFIYELKPQKNKSGVINKWYEPIEGEYQYLPFIDLFKSIKLEDAEPVYIDDIVNRG